MLSEFKFCCRSLRQLKAVESLLVKERWRLLTGWVLVLLLVFRI